jgi:hypothetical protein
MGGGVRRSGRHRRESATTLSAAARVPEESLVVVSQWSDHAGHQPRGLSAVKLSADGADRPLRSLPCRPVSFERCCVLATDRYVNTPAICLGRAW